MRKDRVYRFNIVNFMKPDSNYNAGLKPLVYSLKEAEENNLGWHRDGFNIAYYQSQRRKKPTNAAINGKINDCTTSATGGVNSSAVTVA